VKSLDGGEEVTYRSGETIMDVITAINAEGVEVLQTTRGLQ
jgi:hypothetical protein